jgi:hypothetical protein
MATVAPNPLALYVQTVREALVSRKGLHTASLGRVVVPVTLALTVAFVAALLLAPGDDLAFQFRDERGLVTTLSAIALAMASGFAGAAFFADRRPRHGLRAWWLLTGLGFLYFACDELLRFHERSGTFLRVLIGSPAYFKNWNDVIVIGYGVVGLAAVLFFLPKVLRLPVYVELLAIGFMAYALHTVVDSLPHSDQGGLALVATLPTNVIEEFAKLCAGSFFAAAMFTGWRIVGAPPEVVKAPALAT